MACNVAYPAPLTALQTISHTHAFFALLFLAGADSAFRLAVVPLPLPLAPPANAECVRCIFHPSRTCTDHPRGLQQLCRRLYSEGHIALQRCQLQHLQALCQSHRCSAGFQLHTQCARHNNTALKPNQAIWAEKLSALPSHLSMSHENACLHASLAGRLQHWTCVLKQQPPSCTPASSV